MGWKPLWERDGRVDQIDQEGRRETENINCVLEKVTGHEEEIKLSDGTLGPTGKGMED